MNQQALSALIWSVADLLRGDFKQSDYGRVILPFTVLPRVGYEIPFNRHFYVFEPPRPLAEIDADLKRSMDRIKQMIEGLAG